MVQKFLEFVLSKEHIQSKFALVEKRVHFLFDVTLKRSEEEDNLLCWVKLEGNDDNIHRAKEYIIAVCSPCSPALSSLEEAVLNENNNSTSQIDSGLTKQTPSVVEINTRECNHDVSTQQDTATSESLGLEKLNLGNQPVEISRGENLAAQSTQSSNNRQECAYTANGEIHSSRNEKTQQGNEMVATGVRAEISEKQRANEDEEKTSGVSPSTVTDESTLRDFAIKLGYSESKIVTGLSKLGPSADKNALLCELLKAESSVKQLEEGSSIVSYEKPHPIPEDSSCLRPIVIDGSNVAMSHGTQRVFSCRGIGLAVDWFLKRNHRNIKVFVPSWRAKTSRPESPIADQEVLKRLESDRILVWTPSRPVNGRIIKCYDDRYIIKHAAETDGVIVSNDNFRDLMSESHEWKKVIEQRLLMYTFVDDKFMPPDDPLGRHGPTLDEFLKKGCGKLCPYERHCTYGKRCKFLHPERNPIKAEAVPLPPCNEHLPPEVPYGQVTTRRPLPPCPSEHQQQHTRSLPPAPYHKPLPLPPQGEFPQQMARVFPPTLRTGQAVGIGERRSDPLPYRKELPPDVQLMREQFERTLSEPSFQDQACGGVPRDSMIRRGSLPHIQHFPSPYPRPPEIMMRGSMSPVPRMTNENGIVNGDWMLQQDQRMYGGYQFPPQFPSNPPVSSQSSVYESHQPSSHPPHWRISPFPQQQPPYPPVHYQYSPAEQYSPGQFHHRGYGRTPFHGQGNSYIRSRAPPIIDGWCGDVTDDPSSSSSSSSSSLEVEKLRIEAFEKLCEVFPDNVEKVLSILDKHSDETSVEKLMEHMFDSVDDE